MKPEPLQHNMRVYYILSWHSQKEKKIMKKSTTAFNKTTAGNSSTATNSNNSTTSNSSSSKKSNTTSTTTAANTISGHTTTKFSSDACQGIGSSVEDTSVVIPKNVSLLPYLTLLYLSDVYILYRNLVVYW
jgi:cobalamin biosynthesis Mg chelatase CobN